MHIHYTEESIGYIRAEGEALKNSIISMQQLTMNVRLQTDKFLNLKEQWKIPLQQTLDRVLAYLDQLSEPANIIVEKYNEVADAYEELLNYCKF